MLFGISRGIEKMNKVMMPLFFVFFMAVIAAAGGPVGRWFEPATKYLFVGLALAVYVLGIFFGGIG